MNPDMCPLYNLARRRSWNILVAHNINTFLLWPGCNIHICGSPTSYTLVRHLEGNERALSVADLAVLASMVEACDSGGSGTVRLGLGHTCTWYILTTRNTHTFPVWCHCI